MQSGQFYSVHMHVNFELHFEQCVRCLDEERLRDLEGGNRIRYLPMFLIEIGIAFLELQGLISVITIGLEA
jgi:hypothetical protein